MFLADYHVHSEYSYDSQAPVEQCVERAISRGIKEIAFTDHFDPCALSPDYTEYNAEGFFKSIEQARIKYKDKITILAGVEAGQAQLYPQNIKKFLDSFPFDFVIGSVHNVTGDVDLAFESYTMSNVHAWLEQYFLEALEAAKTGLYDVFGHLNYICRYIGRQGIPVKLRDYEELAALVLRQIVSLGKGIEINVSTLRYKGMTALPPIGLIKKYRSLGGEILTIGSDAHVPEHVGLGIERGLQLAKRAGFRYITTFKERKPEFCKIG